MAYVRLFDTDGGHYDLTKEQCDAFEDALRIADRNERVDAIREVYESKFNGLSVEEFLTIWILAQYQLSA